MCRAGLRAVNWRRNADHEIASARRSCTVGGASFEAKTRPTFGTQFGVHESHARPNQNAAISKQSARSAALSRRTTRHIQSLLPCPRHAVAVMHAQRRNERNQHPTLHKPRTTKNMLAQSQTTSAHMTSAVVQHQHALRTKHGHSEATPHRTGSSWPVWAPYPPTHHPGSHNG